MTPRSVVLPYSRFVVDVTDDTSHGRLRDPIADVEEDWTPASPEPRVAAVRVHVDVTRRSRPATTTMFGTGTPATVSGVTGRTRRRTRTPRWPVTWAAETFWWCEVRDVVRDVQTYR